MVPPAFPGEPIVCLGDGPSLTREDVAYCRGRARVIAVNFSARLAPWADVVYSYHTDRIQANAAIDPATYPGLIVSLKPGPAPWTVLRDTGPTGLELDPRGLRSGHNSGYGAINLAVHLIDAVRLRAGKIVLLGYDMQRAEDGSATWFGRMDASVTRPSPEGLTVYDFARWLRCYRSLAAPLAALGVEVINATRRTALDVFPRQPLTEALA